jgi:hypothetical protein
MTVLNRNRRRDVPRSSHHTCILHSISHAGFLSMPPISTRPDSSQRRRKKFRPPRVRRPQQNRNSTVILALTPPLPQFRISDSPATQNSHVLRCYVFMAPHHSLLSAALNLCSSPNQNAVREPRPLLSSSAIQLPESDKSESD